MNHLNVIIEVDTMAPKLTGAAYKVLWRLIALANTHGNPALRVSHKYLAQELSLAKESVAQALRDLRGVITVRNDGNAITTFILPDRWVGEQVPLFASDRPLMAHVEKSVDVRTEGVTPPPWPPGNMPTKQPGDRTVRLVTRQGKGLEYRATYSNQDTCSLESDLKASYGDDMGTRARVESNRIEYSGGSADYLVLVKAFHTVEILPEQWDDARILSDSIIAHRMYFDSDASASSRRDRKVLARLLAIAPLEDICDSIHELLAEKRPPGKSDMWYFTVLLDRIHGIDHRVTAAYIEREKSKALSNESRGPLFGDSLLDEVAGKLRRIS